MTCTTAVTEIIGEWKTAHACESPPPNFRSGWVGTENFTSPLRNHKYACVRYEWCCSKLLSNEVTFDHLLSWMRQRKHWQSHQSTVTKSDRQFLRYLPETKMFEPCKLFNTFRLISWPMCYAVWKQNDQKVRESAKLTHVCLYRTTLETTCLFNMSLPRSL